MGAGVELGVGVRVRVEVRLVRRYYADFGAVWCFGVRVGVHVRIRVRVKVRIIPPPATKQQRE